MEPQSEHVVDLCTRLMLRVVCTVEVHLVVAREVEADDGPWHPVQQLDGQLILVVSFPAHRPRVDDSGLQKEARVRGRRRAREQQPRPRPAGPPHCGSLPAGGYRDRRTAGIQMVLNESLVRWFLR